MPLLSYLESMKPLGSITCFDVRDHIDIVALDDSTLSAPPMRWLRKGGSSSGPLIGFAFDGLRMYSAGLPEVAFEARVPADEVLVSLAAGPEPIVVNGVRVEGPSLTIGGAGGRLHAHWTVGPSQLRFGVTFAIAARLCPPSWSVPRGLCEPRRVAADAMGGLLATIEEALALAAGDPAAFVAPDRLAATRDRLLAAIDRALVDAEPLDVGALAAQRQTLERVVDFIDGHHSLRCSIDEIAEGAKISSRMLHNLTTRFYGLSPYAFLKIRRLIAARRNLLTARGKGLVKRCAIDAGYWHLGRFSKDYRDYFGESPSATLRRFADLAPGEEVLEDA